MSECMSVTKRSSRPSLLQSKTLIPIEPQGVFGKQLAALLDERLAADVLVVVVVALHVQDVEVGPAVVVDVDRAGVAGPADVSIRPVACRDVDEAVVAHVLVQDAPLGALGLEVAREGVLEAPRSTGSPSPAIVVGGVLADVDEEQVEPAVAVVVEEDRARGVAHVVQARRRRRCRVNCRLPSFSNRTLPPRTVVT